MWTDEARAAAAEARHKSARADMLSENADRAQGQPYEASLTSEAAEAHRQAYVAHAHAYDVVPDKAERVKHHDAGRRHLDKLQEHNAATLAANKRTNKLTMDDVRKVAR